MENKIKELIESWKETTIDETRLEYIADTSRRIIGQLQSLLELYQAQSASRKEPTIHDTIYRIGEK